MAVQWQWWLRSFIAVSVVQPLEIGIANNNMVLTASPIFKRLLLAMSISKLAVIAALFLKIQLVIFFDKFFGVIPCYSFIIF